MCCALLKTCSRDFIFFLVMCTTFKIQIVNHLEDNKEVFAPYMEDDEPFDDYIGRMRGDAEWGGNQELVAASQLYKVRCCTRSDTFPPQSY